MALVIKDRIKENTTTTGTGDISLGGAAATYASFSSVMSNGDTTYYAIAHTASGVDEWEVGLGTWNTGNTLSRTTVIAGSNGTSAVNLSAGSKEIFMSYVADKAVYKDASGNLASVNLSNFDTDDLSEGSTNQYFTNARVDARLSGGTGVTYNAGAISIGQSVGTTDAVTFDDVTVNGDLTVSGTTTTVNSTTVSVDDPIFTIGGDTAPSSDDNKDRGIEFRWHDGSYAKLGFFGFDDSTGKFTFIPDATNSSEVFSGTAGTIVAAFEGNVTGNVTGNLTGNVTGNLTGDVTGNADTATALATSRTISLTGDVTGSASFDGTGNAAITAVVVDDSHAHVISNVDGLQTALDGKTAETRTITSGNGLTGGGDLSANRTLAVGAGNYINVNADDIDVDATDANTASKVVARDSSGNFSAGTITASLTGNVTGNADTATTLATARTIAGNSFNGSANIDIDLADLKNVHHIAVTVNGSSKYVIDGTAQDTVVLQPSVLYRFDQSDSSNSGHPLVLSATSDGTHNSGSAYTSGVTSVGTPGSAGAYTQVRLEQDAPSVLYYYCSNHSGMGGAINGSIRHDQDNSTASGGTLTIDLAAANNHKITMTAATTLAFTNKDAGRFGNLIFVQNATGGYSFTLPSECKTPVNGASIVQATGANEVSILSYYVLDSSNILVNYIGDFA